MEDPQHKWSVDKRIPLAALIGGAVFILGQTALLAWWTSALSYRVEAVESFMKTAQPQSAQIAVIQEKVTTMQATLQKIESWLVLPLQQRHQP